jgi:hypothetical protein
MTSLKDYEVIEYEGKEYFIKEQAEISHSTKVRIGDSILCLEGTIYEAPCIDKDGNKYTAYWVANPSVELPENACRWDKPDYIEKA